MFCKYDKWTNKIRTSYSRNTLYLAPRVYQKNAFEQQQVYFMNITNQIRSIRQMFLI